MSKVHIRTLHETGSCHKKINYGSETPTKTRLGCHSRSHPVYDYHLFKLIIHYCTLNKNNAYNTLILRNTYKADP